MTLRDSQNTAILIESNYFASGGEGNVYRIYLQINTKIIA